MSTVTVSREHVPARVAWLGVAACTLLAGAGWLAVWSVRDDLPARVAKHWGPDGMPDGYQSLGSFMVFQVVFVLGLGLATLALGWQMRAARLTTVFATGLCAFLAVVLAGSVLCQRGAADASRVPLQQWLMFPGLGAALVTGLVMWVLVRRRGPLPAASGTQVPAGAPELSLAPGQSVAWSGRTRRSAAVSLVLLVAGVLPMVAVAVLAGVSRQWGMAAFMLVPLVFVLLCGVLLDAQVTVGRRGVRALGLGIVPLISIPLENITSADAVDRVSALTHTGGWGFRIGLDGSRYLATAAGPALRIHRAGLPDVLVTVDDAERAAATVNTLVTRREGERHA